MAATLTVSKLAKAAGVEVSTIRFRGCRPTWGSQWVGTYSAIESTDIIILNNQLAAVVEAREISRWSYRKMVQNVGLAVLCNGIERRIMTRTASPSSAGAFPT